MMTNQEFEVLLAIQKELSTNTEQTKGINTRLDTLNGKVAANSKKIGKLTFVLTIVGTAVATLLFMNGSEFYQFIISII